MAKPARLKPGSWWTPIRRSTRSAVSAVSEVAGTLAAIALGAVTALVFAATLAFVLVIGIALLGLMTLAWRLKQRPMPRRIMARSRRAGHGWVTYDWDRRSF